MFHTISFDCLAFFSVIYLFLYSSDEFVFFVDKSSLFDCRIFKGIYGEVSGT